MQTTVTLCEDAQYVVDAVRIDGETDNDVINRLLWNYRTIASQEEIEYFNGKQYRFEHGKPTHEHDTDVGE